MRQASRFKRMCVFCGSSQGKKTSYHDAAIELAKELVARDIDLVYGGGSIGLMGLVSQAVYDGGRHVIGVIPRTLMTPEIIGETVGEVRPVADMHQRKAEMARQSDAFIALPGGYGTLEELLEVITWAQLGIHRKPIGLLNVDGYYNSLLTFMDQAVEEGFINPSARRIVVSTPTARELMGKLEEYVPYHDRVASGLNWETDRLGLRREQNKLNGPPGGAKSGVGRALVVKPPPSPVGLPPVRGGRSRQALKKARLRLEVDAPEIYRLAGVFLLLWLALHIIEEYVPYHDRVASGLNWETDRLGF